MREWLPIETVTERGFLSMFADNVRVLVATSDGRVTIGSPFITNESRLWACALGSNCSDPRWPQKYLPLTVTHWQPLPDLPAQGIEAGTDETLQAAQPVGQEPGGVAMRPETPSSQDTDQ